MCTVPARLAKSYSISSTACLLTCAKRNIAKGGGKNRMEISYFPFAERVEISGGARLRVGLSYGPTALRDEGGNGRDDGVKPYQTACLSFFRTRGAYPAYCPTRSRPIEVAVIYCRRRTAIVHRIYCDHVIASRIFLVLYLIMPILLLARQYSNVVNYLLVTCKYTVSFFLPMHFNLYYN